jgi:hypothetical protein
MPNDRLGSGWCELDMNEPLGSQQGADTAKQGDGIAPDADVAVGQQRVLPEARARDGAEDAALEGIHIAGSAAGLTDGSAADVDPERMPTSVGKCSDQPARSAAHVKRRSDAAREQGLIARQPTRGPIGDRKAKSLAACLMGPQLQAGQAGFIKLNDGKRGRKGLRVGKGDVDGRQRELPRSARK